MHVSHPAAQARIALPALAVAAALGAMGLLAFGAEGGAALDYGSSAVPVAARWTAAVLVAVVALVGLTPAVGSSIATLLAICLAVAASWSVSTLLFDALRAVGLIPLPLNARGVGVRVLLAVGAVAALGPLLRESHRQEGRCPTCGRWRPGRLARLPRWPIVVGVGFALPYPAFRTLWLLGGTWGTTGSRVEVDRALQLVMACAGALLVVVATTLLVERGPTWWRSLLGLGASAVGVVLAVTFAPAAIGTLTSLITIGPSWSPGSDLMGWVFALFYSSWTLSGAGITLGGVRQWARRDLRCPTCWPANAGHPARGVDPA